MIYSYENERKYGNKVLGIDEVGRGAIAGPVVVAGIVADESIAAIGVRDSKKLSKTQRERIYKELTGSFEYFISIIPPDVVDEINIHNATLLGMKNVIIQMKHDIPALIDGKFAPNVDRRMHTIVRGDATFASIAAASIIAKVTRDRIMQELHQTSPHYNWIKNVGYGTKEHFAAINDNGISNHHRKSFLKSLSKFFI